MIRTAFALALVATSALALAGKVPQPAHTATPPVTAESNCSPASAACDAPVVSRGHADLDARLRGPDLNTPIATA